MKEISKFYIICLTPTVDSSTPHNVTSLKVVTYLNDISFRLTETDKCLAEMHVKGKISHSQWKSLLN